MSTHYFKDIEHSKEDYFMFEDYIQDKKYFFNSCSNVFSKNKIDYGSKVLINTIIKNFDALGKRVLDLGSGYGAIGITLASFYPSTHFVLSDITQTAVELSKQNASLNKLKKITVIKSDLYENIEGDFDFIITNPPIKTGKNVLVKAINEAVNILKPGGGMILVIKKEHGKESIKKLMHHTFGGCEVLKREKGYYILYSKKE